MKYELEIKEELVEFFAAKIDDTKPVEKMLVKMLKLLRVMLIMSDKKLQ